MNMRRMISGWMRPRPVVAALATFGLERPAFGFAAQDPAQERCPGKQDPRVGRQDHRATMRYPDLTHPWTKHSPQEASGTGVVIDGKRILTNAHVVLYASQLFVESYQSSDKLPATVEAVSPGNRPGGAPARGRVVLRQAASGHAHGGSPEVKDTVLVYGYPQGGSTLSVTKGIVSRIEFAGYKEGISGVRVQIDAAINPGNSGGPALVDGKMVGLIFSKLTQADNIGYIIPSEEIDLFLKDVADGTYDGKPAIHESLQTLENDALASFLGLDKKAQGMVVHSTDPSNPNDPLKPFDVIAKIGDHEIDNVGMVKIKDNLRLNFHYLIQKVAKDGKVPLTVVREGKTLPIDLPAKTKYPMLISSLKGRYPSYFIYGPLVFSPVTTEFAGARSHGRLYALLASIGSPLAITARRLAQVRGRGAGGRHIADVSPRDRQGIRQPIHQDRQGGQRRAGSRTSATWWKCLRDSKQKFTTISLRRQVLPKRSSSTIRRP